MTVRPRAIAGLLVLVSLLAVLPTASAAESLGVSPASHEVEDAIAGETYVRYVTVQNEFDSPSTLTVTASGEIADWLSLTPADVFPIPAREHEEVELAIHVPDDAMNGTYEGRLHVAAEPKDVPEGSGASLRYAVGVPLTVHVGGDHAPALSFGGPIATDAEAGSTPTIEAPVANEGNARTLAEACALLYPEDGTEPLQRLHGTTLVRPGEQATIAFDAEPLDRDRYRVELFPDCEEIADGTAIGSTTFEIVSPGSLGKEATLLAIEHEPRVAVDWPLELRALLENTGEIDIAEAQVTYRVLHDGELIAVLESPTLIAPAGKTTELPAHLTPEEPGRYDVEAVATYDGRQTEQRDSFFTAAEPASTGSAAGWLAGAAPYLIAILLLTLAAVAYRWANRPKPPAEAPEPAEGLETAHVELIEP